MQRSDFAAMAAILAGLCLTCHSRAADAPKDAGHVRMRHDVYLSEQGGDDFPRPEKGTVLPCAGQTGGGYLVVWRDSQRAPRMALLPHRTEWGHVTATLWLHDASMAPNTLSVLNPTDLRRGAVPLMAGDVYPVVSSNTTGVTVAFELAGYRREITLAPADVERVDPTQLVPPRGREDLVQDALDKAETLQKRLRDELRTSERKKEKLSNLLERLQLTGVENAELAALLKHSHEAYRHLAKWKPQTQEEMAALRKELGEAIREQGMLTTQLKRAELDAEPLRLIHKQLEDANVDVEDLRVQLASRRAEAEALKEELPAEYAADLKKLDDVLAAAREEHGELTKLLSHTERSHQELTTLFESLGLIGAENTTLNERIAELLEEIEGIRLAMTEAEEAAEPPPAKKAPAPEKKRPWRQKPAAEGNAGADMKPVRRPGPAGEAGPNAGKKRVRPPQPVAADAEPRKQPVVPPQPAPAEDAGADAEPAKAPRPAMEKRGQIRPLEPAIIEPPADDIK